MQWGWPRRAATARRTARRTVKSRQIACSHSMSARHALRPPEQYEAHLKAWLGRLRCPPLPRDRAAAWPLAAV